MYFENGYDESSSRGAPLRTVRSTVALHAMYDTVHRPLINTYSTVDTLISVKTVLYVDTDIHTGTVH